MVECDAVCLGNTAYFMKGVWQHLLEIFYVVDGCKVL